jgi:hypothetical protein
MDPTATTSNPGSRYPSPSNLNMTTNSKSMTTQMAMNISADILLDRYFLSLSRYSDYAFLFLYYVAGKLIHFLLEN